MSDRDFFARIDEVFSRVVGAEPDERGAVLDRECMGDANLRSEVESLLAEDSSGGVLPEALSLESGAGLFEETPKAIGRYRILGVLGRGGMGEVFEAEQDSPKRTVALKVLRKGLSRGARRRFEHEAELLGRLSHPCIAQVYDAGADDEGRPWFAMELVRGRRLDEYIRETDPGIPARLGLFALICDAVHHAHQNGVIHRDLKPANILVTDDGTPKVLDLGVARVAQSDDKPVTLETMAGQVIGTLQYMSPEQAEGRADQIDTRTDVYALGVILYEMLSGRLPYDLADSSIIDSIRVIRDQQPDRLSTQSRNLRGDVETIVGKALEKDRDRRYPSAAELAGDVRRFLSNEPIIARPATTVYQLTMFVRRNKHLAAGLTLAAAALIIGSAMSLWFGIDAVRAREEAIKQAEVAVAAQEAEAEQRELAEQRFREVRKLANTLIKDIEGKINRLPGATEARELIVKTGLEYLDSVSAEVGEDPELINEIAFGYLQMGNVQANPGSRSLGQTEAGLVSLQRSAQMYGRLRELEPDKVEHLLWLNAVRNITTDVLSYLGRSDEAIATIMLAVDESGIALIENPDHPGLLRSRSLAQAVVANAYERLGRYEESLEWQELAITGIKKLAESNPENARAQRDLQIELGVYTTLLIRLGRYELALPIQEEVLSYHLEQVEAHSRNARTKSDAASAWSQIGNIQLELGDHDQALASYESAFALHKLIADADPNDKVARFRLSVSTEKLGNAYAAFERFDEAEAQYREAIQIRGELYDADPENLNTLFAMGSCTMNLARLLQGLDRADEALERFRWIVLVCDRVTAKEPDSLRAWKMGYDAHFEIAEDRVGRAHEVGRGPAERLELLNEARASLERCIKFETRFKELGVPQNVDPEVRELLRAVSAELDTPGAVRPGTEG